MNISGLRLTLIICDQYTMATLTAVDPALEAQNKNVIFPLPRPKDGLKAYRLEIDEFLADNAMTNLFLLALSTMQENSLKVPKTDEMNWWSFYSIAGMITGVLGPRAMLTIISHPWSSQGRLGGIWPSKRTEIWILPS